MLTQKELKEILFYDDISGIFTWKKRLARCLTVGDEAGCVNGDGYVQIRIKGKIYTAHRLAWLHTHGKFPEGPMDHKNLIKTDNAILNLRPCTWSENSANKPKSSNNTSGFKNVVWSKKSEKWQAQIGYKRKTIYLGQYDNKHEAALAYNEKAIELFGEFARLNTFEGAVDAVMGVK